MRSLGLNDVPVASANARFCNFSTRRQTDQVGPYNPQLTTAAAYHDSWVWVSLTRVTPRTLGYVPKQPDSKYTSFTTLARLRDYNPLRHPISENFALLTQLPPYIEGHNSSALLDIGFSLDLPHFTRSYYGSGVKA
jgi:hypothetical protein